MKIINKIISYLKEVYAEMKRVDWPDKQTVYNSTKIVVVISLVLAGILAIIDTGLTEGLKYLLGFHS